MIVFFVIALILLLAVLLLFGSTVFAVVLAVLLFTALLRVGGVIEYSEDGFSVRAKIGIFKLKLYPFKEKTEIQKQRSADRKAKRKARKKAKLDAMKKPEEKKPGKLKDFLDMLPAIKETLYRVKRKLLIKNLTIHYTAAGSDPSKAALAYGSASAVFSLIAPVLDMNFNVKRRDFRTSVDFETDKQTIYVYAAATVAIWEGIYIVSELLRYLAVSQAKKITLNKPVRKEVKENG